MTAHHGVATASVLVIALLHLDRAIVARVPTDQVQQTPRGERWSTREAADVVTATAADVLGRTAAVGLSVAIGDGARVVFERGFGRADVASGTSLKADAVMDIGSIGKQFTAAAILQLVEEARVDLDRPVVRYLPAWHDQGRGVTVRQLLQHMSGLEDPPFSEVEPEARFLKPATTASLLAFLQGATWRHPPGATWQYANTGYQILGLVLEQLHGKPYGRVIEDVIARPLGLESLVLCDKSRAIPNRVRDYMVRNGTPAAVPPVDVTWFGGAGSLCATAGDLVRWEQALWRGQVLTPRRVDQMHRDAVMRDRAISTTVGYGFGRTVGARRGHRKFAHPGTGGGISAMLTGYPDDGLVLAVLVNTNGEGVPHAREIEARLAATLLALSADAEERDVGVTAAERAAWSGTYRSWSYGSTTMVVEECGSALCASTSGNRSAPLRHLGGGVFVMPGVDGEWQFRPSSGPARWVVRVRHGVHDDVLQRIDDR